MINRGKNSYVSLLVAFSAMTAKLKGGKMRYGPMTSKLADELEVMQPANGNGQLFPPRAGAAGVVEGLRGVLRICCLGRKSVTTAFTICGTPSRLGT
jgi:hypothetical protein